MTINKKVTAIVIVIAVVFAFMPVMGGETFATAKKPGKATIKAKVTKNKIKLAFKAKNAKKYKVYQKKSGKWKVIKTVKTKNGKKKTYEITVKKAGIYKFRIRAFNGSKKGKYSKTATVKMKKKNGKLTGTVTYIGNTNNSNIRETVESEDIDEDPDEDPVTTSMTVKIDGKTVTYKLENTYNISLKNAVRKVTILNLIEDYTDDGTKFIYGITSDGMDFGLTVSPDGTYFFEIGEQLFCDASKDGDTVYFTIDNTEPQVPQEDKFYDGPMEYNETVWDLRYAGTFTKGDYWPDKIYVDKNSPYYDNYGIWYKVYRNGKFIQERYYNNPNVEG